MAKINSTRASSPVIPATEGCHAGHSPARPGAKLDLGLTVEITPRAYVVYCGTAAELTEEGVIPAGFVFPGKEMKCWDEGDFSYSICTSRYLDVPFAQWQRGDKDHWQLRRGLVANRGEGLKAATIYDLQQQIAQKLNPGFEWSAWREAAQDDRFQSLLVAVGAKPAPKARKSRKGQA